MDSFLHILARSLEMLYRRPNIFVPKLFSTFLSSSLMVALLFYYPQLIRMDPVVLGAFMLVSLASVTFVGVFVSLMVASMVKNFDRERLLYRGFSDALGSSGKALKATFAVLGASLVISVIFVLGYSLYISTGSLLGLALTAILTVSTVLFLSYAAYFLPITLLESSSFRRGFYRSFSFSSENRTSVISLVSFSALLLVFAFISTGVLEALGYAGFVAGRLISTVVNTYLFVISPNYYLDSGS